MVRRLGTALFRLYDRTTKADLGMISASVAFYGFLSLFPALAATIAIVGFVADPAIVESQMALAQEVLPSDAFQILNTQVQALLGSTSRALGWATALSTLLALWSARAGVAALIHGVNAIHHLPHRSGPRHLALALILTLALVATALVALLATVVAPLGIGFLPLGPAQAATLRGANAALGLAAVFAGLALFYRFGPNRPPEAPRPIFTLGLLLAVAAWGAVTRGFTYYLENFGSYNEVYGSIGAVAVFLMWLYLSAYAILLGAAVDAERAKKTLP